LNVKVGNKVIKNFNYSPQEEEILISMKRRGHTDAEIASICNRSYWSVVDKIRRLRIAGII